MAWGWYSHVLTFYLVAFCKDPQAISSTPVPHMPSARRVCPSLVFEEISNLEKRPLRQTPRNLSQARAYCPLMVL